MAALWLTAAGSSLTAVPTSACPPQTLTAWTMVAPLPPCLGGSAVASSGVRRLGGSGGEATSSAAAAAAARPLLTPQAGKVLIGVWVVCNVLIVWADRESSWDLLGPSFTAPRPWDYLV